MTKAISDIIDHSERFEQYCAASAGNDVSLTEPKHVLFAQPGSRIRIESLSILDNLVSKSLTFLSSCLIGHSRRKSCSRLESRLIMTLLPCCGKKTADLVKSMQQFDRSSTIPNAFIPQNQPSCHPSSSTCSSRATWKPFAEPIWLRLSQVYSVVKKSVLPNSMTGSWTSLCPKMDVS